MNKKILVIYTLSAVLLLTSCGNNSSNNIDPLINSNTTPDDLSVTSSVVNSNTLENADTGSYDFVGQVIQIESNRLHILSGDIVEIFTVSASDLNTIYLGQTVSIEKESDTDYSVMPFIVEDFDTRFTSMGDRINTDEGLLLEMNDTKLTFSMGDENISFENSSDFIFEIGKTYTLEYTIFPDNSHHLINSYDETTAINLNIVSLDRNAQGELIITAANRQHQVYTIPTYSAVKNFNLSKLAIDQSIRVYVTATDDSSPILVATNRIDLLGGEATAISQIDYDLYGEVMEIDGNIVSILSGDLYDSFQVDQQELNSIYLGEFVHLYTKEGKIHINAYLNDDPSQLYTNMGNLIEETTGTIVSIEQNESDVYVTYSRNDKEHTLLFTGYYLPVVGETYDMGLVSSFSGEVAIQTAHNIDAIIEMTIQNITRAGNGAQLLATTDAEGGEYSISTFNTYHNFNLSELKVGDVLDVYATEVMESWPMQVNTQKILKK